MELRDWGIGVIRDMAMVLHVIHNMDMSDVVHAIVMVDVIYDMDMRHGITTWICTMCSQHGYVSCYSQHG